MSHLLSTIEIEYVGGDIVKPLIEELNRKFKQENISFIHFDLINDTPIKCDLMICRDCLFHLSYKDTKSVLENFMKSEIPYLLTTTHKNNEISFINSDIITGDFRLIDLFSPPYNFPTNPLFVIQDWVAPDPERQMCLWNRDQISSVLSRYLTHS